MRLTVEGAVSAVRRYLDSGSAYPFFVAVESTQETDSIIQSLGTDFRQVKLSNYCPPACPDSFPEEDELIEALYQNRTHVFIRGIGEYMTLFSHSSLLSALFCRTFPHKTVVFGRNLSEKLAHLQMRESKFTPDRWCAVDSESDFSVVAVRHPTMAIHACENIQQLFQAIETGTAGQLYVRTNLILKNIPCITSAWDAVRARFISFDVPENALSPEQWEEYLNDDDLEGKSVFHWRTFLRQKLYGAQTDYFRLVMDNSPDYAAYRHSIASAILRCAYKDTAFRKLYAERKELLRQYPDYDISEYIRDSRAKDRERIHYLTDNTKEERRAIVEELAHMGEIPDDLPVIYPDLAAYLDVYDFRTAEYGKQFTEYFEHYKLQKVFNKIEPDFLQKVEEWSGPGKRPYQALPTRGMMLTRLRESGTGLYWLDALGVEYLGFIRKAAKRLDLRIKIHIAQTSLPTTTRLPSIVSSSMEERKHNGSFHDNWIGYKRPRDETLDRIKHEGVRPEKKLETAVMPAIHLADELEIIWNAMKEIKKDLIEDRAEKILLVSDHGASRLCVLYQHENQWTMTEKGKYSGRCCPVQDADSPPESATKESGFWVLANYDRFQGSRPAIVEVHGGASLEEVLIPLIEIELSNQRIECYVPGFQDAEWAVIHRETIDEKPVLRLYCSSSAARIRVKINKQIFTGVQQEQNKNLFYVTLDGHWNARTTYEAIVSDGDNDLTTIRFRIIHDKKANTKATDGTEFFQ